MIKKKVVFFGILLHMMKVCRMQYKAAIFDMDGLLIDSEPLWQEAGIETLSGFGISLSLEQYHTSTGLRTAEWVAHWFRQYAVSQDHAGEAIDTIIRKAIEKIAAEGVALPGASAILEFFKTNHIKTGLATSSPMSLVDVVVDKLDIRHYFKVMSSAEHLPFGKPHPQVFLDCAAGLGVLPEECIVFEDSFNGMIAAKAAKMKCVVVPARDQFSQPRWSAADLKLTTLEEFSNDNLFKL
jgi:mannitol-1-/sugar-/sorbitol-6-/2-deoxyglucose-6-phosphatase